MTTTPSTAATLRAAREAYVKMPTVLSEHAISLAARKLDAPATVREEAYRALLAQTGKSYALTREQMLAAFDAAIRLAEGEAQ